MLIGLDATPVWGPPVGQYTYMACLIKAMLELKTDHKFAVYCRREIPKVLQPYTDRATFRMCGFKNRKFCEQICVPRHASSDGVDVLHTCWSMPFFYRRKSVFTIHGLEWRTHPDIPLHSNLNLMYYRFSIENTCRRATRLVAISEFIKDAFVDIMHVPEERIDVVYHGVDRDSYHQVTDEARLAEIRKKYSLPERFVLFVGAMVANKNLPRLLRAFAATKHENAMTGSKFVIVGGGAWNSKPLYSLVSELGLQDDVIFTGYVPADDIPGIYSLSTIYAFPSLVEGFGLPVLEAFACGTPVLTSNVTAMPEVAGDAAVLVDPLDQEAISEALLKLMGDDELRRALVEKGFKRADEFTWEKTAKKTLAVYEKAFAS